VLPAHFQGVGLPGNAQQCALVRARQVVHVQCWDNNDSLMKQASTHLLHNLLLFNQESADDPGRHRQAWQYWLHGNCHDGANCMFRLHHLQGRASFTGLLAVTALPSAQPLSMQASSLPLPDPCPGSAPTSHGRHRVTRCRHRRGSQSCSSCSGACCSTQMDGAGETAGEKGEAEEQVVCAGV